MTDTSDKLDYSKTLYLPQTEFPMRAGLPEKEPEIVARWQEMDLYRRLREDGATLESLGSHLGISKERVRQIENRALEKLRTALTRISPELAGSPY